MKMMMHAEYFGVLPVVQWLEAYTSAVERTGQDRWQFKLNSGLDLTGTAFLDHDWLRLFSRLAGRRPGKPIEGEILYRLLLQNATLPGGVKFSLSENSEEVLLAVEIPVEDDESRAPVMDHWIGEACAGLRQGALKWSILHARGVDTPSVPAVERQTTIDEGAEGQLAELCDRAGWSYTTRANGQVAIRLDVRDAFCQALLGPKTGKMRRLRVSLGMATSAEGDAPLAVHLLLLSASRLVRLARASASPAGDAIEYRWEVTLPVDYDARILERALGSLSVACQLTARELQAMEDQKIARQYLAMRGL